MSLSIESFSQFFSEVHGANYHPFPWQIKLLQSVVEKGWPEAIGAPTASGKTAVLDIAVFALALDLARTLPRRLFFVVDRRIVVDQTYEHALKIQKAIKEAPSGSLCRTIGERLAQIGGPELFENSGFESLQVHQLRGGVYRDQTWASTPSIPTIVCSTVDQVGSRLLFRGYGVSEFSSPYQAGLTATDTLIILDEAHCSTPFKQTIQRISRYAAVRDVQVGKPLAVTVMSATHGPEVKSSIKVQGADYADRVLGPRLTAKKYATLHVAEKAKGSKWSDRLAKDLVSHATSLVTEHRLGTVAVIVNRVATARHIFRGLKKQNKNSILLTGRMRELDREKLLKQYASQLLAGKRSEINENKPLYVVATQCVEVGANFDFEGMVTECASLDALRQRFGRLDRLGERGLSHARIVIAQEQLSAKTPDPIYGTRAVATWQFLSGLAREDGKVDIGTNSLSQELSRWTGDELSAPTTDAPILLPTHMDCLVQSSPRPRPDVDPSVFLRGVDTGTPDVRVLWRHDVYPTMSDSHFRELMEVVPPATSETLPVPLHTFRRWLINDLHEDLSGDVEQTDSEATDVQGEPMKAVYVWRGPEEGTTGRLKRVNALRPGDTIVLTELDHLKQLGDVPKEIWSRHDLGDLAQFRGRNQLVLRLGYLLDAEDKTEISAGARAGEALQGAIDAGELTADLLRRQLEEYGSTLSEDDPHKEIAAKLSADSIKLSSKSLRRYPGENRIGVILKLSLKGKTNFTHEDDTAYSGDPVGLADHCRIVGELASYFGKSCNLSEELVHDLMLAGLWHDLGKADPKFQAWLYDGSQIMASAGKLLAKSRQNRYQRKLYKLMARYPDGKRHEFLSASWIAGNPALSEQPNDLDLVLHLVATHHGRARPLAELIEESDPTEISFNLNHDQVAGTTDPIWSKLENGHLDRFWRCVRKYGWWGLAFLESILICADHRASENPRLRLASSDNAKPQDTGSVSSGVPLHNREFPHLDGSEILGFLSSLGLLRTLSKPYPQARLSWKLGRVWHPVLWLPESLPDSEFPGTLASLLNEVSWSRLMEMEDNTHKLEPGSFRAHLIQAVDGWLSSGKRDEVDWLSALACESATNDGFLSDTKLRTMSGAGHQHFLKTMRQLREETTQEHLEACLSGPWKYEDGKPSLRFDPEDDRRYALRWREPSKDPVRTVRGANRLAVEAIPLFTCLPDGSRMQTVGFVGRGARSTFLDWPLWEVPLSLDSVRSLLNHSDWLAKLRNSQLLGVSEVFRSQRITVGKVRNFTPSRSRLSEDEKLTLLL
ncbi:MAG: type I-U CRISPR-associated helicase/endonuclease Cas3 [Vulcanimicrobiota bacterium]